MEYEVKENSDTNFEVTDGDSSVRILQNRYLWYGTNLTLQQFARGFKHLKVFSLSEITFVKTVNLLYYTKLL